ncbi:syntaxin-71-like isoform X2 [Olea europaea var. sylvestris]|uniref:syntaxin-71-like isoform X2 n=1 Tax=Olea europaea var. sylvestris TaxID=158386 RepID=UPI000C1D450D|nr:syntaxin-71-like isoform X2 [Olea europaea var. sylvestris]XP_022887337.1 syntaxin-71-like isoform X2 [Olea europaea var. sylvestris]XP_022887338.1 syntaxin-71-like isoform X2 [Olea europaea var. sylvestris]XP_022887339.1 syntaxin-71-like isoform X2 [Olea europaea var. sylvestris]
MWKMRQDQGLDVIAQGLDTLKNTSHEMNEELYRQVPLTDEIDTKVDQATSDLKNTNFRLKDTVNQLRSSRNFFIDIIFLCIILGIADYFIQVSSQFGSNFVKTFSIHQKFFSLLVHNCSSLFYNLLLYIKE